MQGFPLLQQDCRGEVPLLYREAIQVAEGRLKLQITGVGGPSKA